MQLLVTLFVLCKNFLPVTLVVFTLLFAYLLSAALVTCFLAGASTYQTNLYAFVNPRVAWREWVPPLAANSLAVIKRTAADVDGVQHRFQMIGVYTIATTAFVIQFFAFWDKANQHEIGRAMCSHVLPVIKGGAVSFFGESTSPQPTRRSLFNFSPERVIDSKFGMFCVIAGTRAIDLFCTPWPEFVSANRADFVGELPGASHWHVSKYNIIDLVKV